MADGTAIDAHAGDVTALPQGHDAWVVGDEPVIVVDWFGASNSRAGWRATPQHRGGLCGARQGSRSSVLRIFPVGPLGSSVRNLTSRGHL